MQFYGISILSLLTMAALLLLGLWVTYLVLFSDYGISKGWVLTPEQKSNVIQRMEAYAELSNQTVNAKRGLLSPEAHKILLGTLKKVEQKNRVMAAVTTFLLSLVVGIALRQPAQATVSGDDLEVQMVFALALMLMLFPIYHVYVGINHLGRYETAKLINRDLKGPALEEEMQQALLIDLLKKERAFAISKVIVSWASAVIVVYAVLRVISASWVGAPDLP